MLADGPDGKPARRGLTPNAFPIPVFYCAVGGQPLGKPHVGALLVAPLVLAGALLALCLYAAFAHGAVAAGDEERLQLP
jgi:hypothetical protein